MRAYIYLQTLALRLRKDKAGAVATEYAFLVAFIAIVAAAGMGLLGENLSTFFDDIGQALDGAGDNIPAFPGTS
jgi:Flp pilus assembly pilin Flp